MNPVDFADEYVLIVAGTTAPGVVEILEADDEDSYDDKEASGQEGASTTYQGRKLRGFKSRHSLVVDPVLGLDEISDWEVFCELLRSSVAGTTPVALDVWHPDLAVQGITSATKRKVGALKHDGKGGATGEVTWKEYQPPKPKTPAGTSGSKSNTKNNPNGSKAYGDDLVEEAKDELESLLSEGDP
jgi:hypothetical protein